MPWIREGECNGCGSCCTGADHLEEEIGQKVVEHGMCPLFRWANKEKTFGRCTGHATNNPHKFYMKGCNVWPNDPYQLTFHPKCSYSFRWED